MTSMLSSSGNLAPLLARDHILNGSGATRLPKLMYGTAWKRESTPHLVIKAIQNGFRALDTAAQPRNYEEAFVGDAVRALDREGFIKRDKLFIQTKFVPLSVQGPIPPYSANAPLEEQVRQSILSSLKNFTMTRGEPYLDCVVLHKPLPKHADTIRVWRVLESFHPTQIRNLGLSNTTLAQLQAINEVARIKPAVVQNCFHRDTDFDADLRRWCRERNIVYQAFWVLPANVTMLHRRPVVALAERLGVTRVEAYFALVLGLGSTTILTGPKTIELMRRDLLGVEAVARWAQGAGREEWESILHEFRGLACDLDR